MASVKVLASLGQRTACSLQCRCRSLARRDCALPCCLAGASYAILLLSFVRILPNFTFQISFWQLMTLVLVSDSCNSLDETVFKFLQGWPSFSSVFFVWRVAITRRITFPTRQNIKLRISKPEYNLLPGIHSVVVCLDSAKLIWFYCRFCKNRFIRNPVPPLPRGPMRFT